MSPPAPAPAPAPARTALPVEEQFLAKLREHPNDDEVRAVYSDWLEEQSRMQESEFLKLQLTLKAMKPTDFSFEQKGNRLRELAKVVDQKWRTLVANAPIEKCEARFDFVCPKKWEALAPTEKDDVRYCDGCKKDVHYSKTLFEAYTNAQQGRCVVVDLVQLRYTSDIDSAGTPQPTMPSDMPMMPAGAIAPPSGWNNNPPLFVNPPAPLLNNEEEPKKNVIERIKSIFRR